MLPEPGYLAGVRALTREHGTYLVNDETHIFSAGPGGATAAWSLDPDVITIGKAVGGGLPVGAYGLSAELAERLTGRTDLDLIDMGGVGGTLAGNPVSMAATRATLTEVLTDAAFTGMIEVATAFTDGVRKIIADYALPWSVAQLGARVEYRFTTPAPPPPRPPPPTPSRRAAVTPDNAPVWSRHKLTPRVRWASVPS